MTELEYYKYAGFMDSLKSMGNVVKETFKANKDAAKFVWKNGNTQDKLNFVAAHMAQGAIPLALGLGAGHLLTSKS